MKERWMDRWFTGHVRLGPLVIYGANAMHWAINWRTRRGYVCFHPPTRTFGARWPWYLYYSRDATPHRAFWGYGPGFREEGGTLAART